MLPDELVWVGALGGAVQIALCFALVWPHMAKNIGRQDFSSSFERFVATSTNTRLGHAIHNFAASAIINGALSQYAPGSIALYQYASRFASGVLSISVGPHGIIYHSKIAKLWSQRHLAEIPAVQKNFLKQTLPLQVAASVVVALLLPSLAVPITNNQISGAQLTSLFLMISFWNLVAELERVHVGVVLDARTGWAFIAINFLFALNLFILAEYVSDFDSPTLLIACAALAQSLNFVLYRWLAKQWLRKSVH